MSRKIKFAKYDEKGTFLGYKSDTFWTISKDYPKLHSEEQSDLVKRVGWMDGVNHPKTGKAYNETPFYIVIEDAITGEGIAGYHYANVNGKYVLRTEC